MILEKVCNHCYQTKLLEKFVKRTRSPDGFSASCKECCNSKGRIKYALNIVKERKRKRLWRKNNPDKVKAATERRKVTHPDFEWARKIKFKFGITREQYWSMFNKQGGVCAICKNQPSKIRLDVDHCHKTKMVRGLLCNKCNRGLGLFKESLLNLQYAAEYLLCQKVTK